MILKRKLQPPGLPRGTVGRARLDERWAHLLESHEGLAVFAAAGSGKTVQAQMFAAQFGWPLAWMTLDSADRSPSRLLVYLAQALAGLFPDAPQLVEGALKAEFFVEEVAAMLAESVEDRSVLLVLDDCESLVGADQALSALGAFLDYLPPSTRTILLSRDELHGPIGRMMLQGRIARVTDNDLALNTQEARALLSAHGQDARDPGSLMVATNGWIAGVAFDVIAGLGPQQGPDALASYLNQEILARLPREEQEFLLRTSVASVVTARAAVALCGKEGYALWQSLASRHLPATKADRALVYHPRFREFLREQLQAQLPDEVPELQRRHAGLLEELELREEAVEAYLEIGELDAAADVASTAVSALLGRADWVAVLRWLDALGPDRVETRPALQGAAIRALYGARRIPEAQVLIRQLHQQGLLADVAKADPGAVAYFGYTLQWRPAEALSLMQAYEGDFRADAVRYELEAVSGRNAVVPPSGVEWLDMERILSWGLLLQGRLDQLLQLLPAEGDWPPRTVYRTPHPLLGLVWRGDLARARELFDEVPDTIKEGAHTDLWFFHEACLLCAEGDNERALRAAEAAVEHSRKTRFGWEPCFEVMVGRTLLALGRVDDARLALADAISRSSASGNRAYVEWGQTFQGLAFLRVDRPEDAARVLRTAVHAMQRSGRALLLPFAATYLSEAEALLASAEKARAAAEAGYDAAAAMGSIFVLRQALHDVPGVLTRQIESDVNGLRWRRLVGHRRTEPRPPAVSSVEEPPDHVLIEVQTHGAGPDLVVNGVPCLARRIKVLELAAYLALHPDGVDRHRLQERLFPETDLRRGGNYFRQVVHKLRQATGVNLARSPEGHVRWPADVRVDSTDLRFERLLEEGYALSGEERLDRLEAALASVDGPYLPESDLEWAEQRRYQLEVLVVEATVEAAEVAFDLRQVDRARRNAALAIERDPFCEAAYCVLMRVEAAMNSPHGVLAAFQRLTTALDDLGVEPAGTTKHLLRQLRGA